MKKIIITILFCLTLLSLFAGDFVVVVSKSNPIGSISATDLQNIYSGKKTTWNDGKNIAPVFNNGGVKDDFLKEVLKKTLPQYQTFWKKAVFTGTGNPPKEVDGDAAVKTFLGNNSLGIGFISEGSLDGSVKKIEIK